MLDADQPTGGILVITIRSIGDLVRTQSLVQVLRERNPTAPIDLMARSPTAELATLMPEVRNVIGETFRHNHLELGSRWKLARQLRRNRYDTAVVVSSAWKAAMVPFMAGIPRRVGWFGEWRYPAINRPLFRKSSRFPRFIDEMCMLGLSPGEAQPSTWPPSRLVIPAAMQRDWEASAPEAADPRPILMLGPGSQGAERIWPLDNYCELARRATAMGWTVWVSGARHETEMAEAIAAKGGASVRVLTGVPLLPTACQMAHCDAFVGNDAGLLHFAAAIGAPTLGIYGGTLPYTNGPIHSNFRAVGPVLTARLGTEAAWPAVAAVEEQLAVIRAAHPRPRVPHVTG